MSWIAQCPRWTRQILLALVIVLFVESAAPALPAPRVSSPLASAPQVFGQVKVAGDTYLTHLAQATLLSMEVAPALTALRQTPIDQLSETAVIQPRARVLALAEQSALALGATGALAAYLEDVGTVRPAAVDVSQVVGQGLPSALTQSLRDTAGWRDDQLASLQTTVQETAATRAAVATTGLPDDLRQQLLAVGFTQSDVDQTAQALQQRGITNPSLTTRLQQLRASQDELANVRTQALVLWIQLLGTQVAVRQAQGVAARPIATADLDALAADELRLLTHAAQLDALWGNDPRLDVGEGHWWFIERYAAQMVTRLETLMLQAQHRGLVVELLVAQQFHTLALTARAGDAAYVKPELDRLADLLAAQLGVAGYASTQRERAAQSDLITLRAVADPSQQARVAWPVDTATRAIVVQTVSARLSIVSGEVLESNENNNTSSLLFVAGLPYLEQLSADVYNVVMSQLNQVTTQDVLTWITAILTGDSDNPVLLGATMVLSIIPVVGAIPDLISLANDPSLFIKAVSLIGVIGSVGDLLALLGVTAPLAGAAALGDTAAAVLKVLYKGAQPTLDPVFNTLGFTKTFAIVSSLVVVMVKRIQRLNLNLSNDPLAVLQQILTGTGQLWESFVAFAQRCGVNLLSELGFDEGAALVGGSLHRGVQLSDDSIRATRRIGNELADAGVELSTAASDGVARVTDHLGEPKARQFLYGARCALLSVSATTPQASRFAWFSPRVVLASGNHCPDTLEIVGARSLKWSLDALDGLDAVVTRSDKARVNQTLDRLSQQAFADATIQNTFAVLGKQAVALSDDAVEGIARLVDAVNGIDPARVQNLLQNVAAGDLEQVLTGIRNWDAEAITGFTTVIKPAPNGTVIAGEQRLAQVLTTYVNDPTITNQLFGILSGQSVGWNNKTFEHLVQVFQRYKGVEDIVIQRIEVLKNVEGIDRVVQDLGGGAGTTVRGTKFQLELAEEIGANNIQHLEYSVVVGQKGPDFVLANGNVVEAKAFVWDDISENFMLDRLIDECRRQVILRTSQFPGRSIEVVFQGADPANTKSIKLMTMYQTLINTTHPHVTVRWHQ